MTTAPSTSPLLSVYDGQCCIGFVFTRGKQGFEAFTADQRSLGTFLSQRDAAVAVMRKAAAAIPEIEAKR
jgi:hypothetical protein